VLHVAPAFNVRSTRAQLFFAHFAAETIQPSPEGRNEADTGELCVGVDDSAGVASTTNEMVVAATSAHVMTNFRYTDNPRSRFNVLFELR
jgi:hypothetical protein